MADEKVLETVEEVAPDAIPEMSKPRPYLKVFRVNPDAEGEIAREDAEGLRKY